MFYSKCLLSKKGRLGNVWVAAHCFKRLKKEQVKQIDVASSVDAILNDEADAITYRILGFLLLGVVRIYSKKVEFLFQDCHDALDKLHNFMADKIVNKSITSMRRSYHSITLPERFELDAFNLDILEDQDVSRVDVRSREDITLADASRGEINCSENDEYYGQEDIPSYDALSSAYTPVSDVCSPWFMDIDLDTASPYDINSSKSSMEKLVGTSFSLEKYLEPKMFVDVEKEPGVMSCDEGHQTAGEQIKHYDVEINYHQPARVEKSIDDESMEPVTLANAEKESILDVLLDEGQTCGGQMKSRDLEINYHEPAMMENSIENELVEPMILGDTEKEPNFDMPFQEGHQTDQELVRHPDVEVICQEPETMEESINNEQSMEKLRRFGFSTMDPLQPLNLGEVEKECPIARSSKEGHQMVGKQTKHPDIRINSEEPKEMSPEITSLRNQIQGNSSLSISIDVTPNSKAGGSGSCSPEFLAVRTPAPKEPARVLKKRKCLFDEKVIFSNKEVRDWIDDTSDLVCKRRKAPLTAFHAWKVHKMYTLPKSFVEPLIPCKGVDFKSLASQKKSLTKVSIETAETPVHPVLVDSPVTQMSTKPAETPASPILMESPLMQMSVETAETPLDPILMEPPIIQISFEQTSIAPATPLSRSNSLRLHEVLGVSKADVSKPASPFDNIEKQPTLEEDRESDIGLMDQEVNSSSGDNPGKCEWSARTRRVATYLHQKISSLTEKKGDGVVNLSEVLKQKTRTESARMFFEILVLKTGDYIDVKQEGGCTDIIVQQTEKLKQTVDADDNRSQA